MPTVFFRRSTSKNLASFDAGPPAVWQFVANAGDGRTVEIELRAEMLEGKNTTVFHFSRPAAERAHGKQLPADADVRLTVRFDIEDRNFHWETKRNGGADYHFSTNTHPLQTPNPNPNSHIGFAFTPAPDRQLARVCGRRRIPSAAGVVRKHSRIRSSKAADRPAAATLTVPAGLNCRCPKARVSRSSRRRKRTSFVAEFSPLATAAAKARTDNTPESGKRRPFEEQLLRAAKQFVVRRDQGKTVIAGYPWFLDWGRDTLICARGLLAAGMVEEVKQFLLTFARFEKDGTLPNTIHGNDVSNRDTSDAPLWFALACEELALAQDRRRACLQSAR